MVLVLVHVDRIGPSGTKGSSFLLVLNSLKTWLRWVVVVVCLLSWHLVGRGFCVQGLVYKMISRTAEPTQRNPCLEKKPNSKKRWLDSEIILSLITLKMLLIGRHGGKSSCNPSVARGRRSADFKASLGYVVRSCFKAE